MPQRRVNGRNLRMAGCRENPLCGISPLAMHVPGPGHGSPRPHGPNNHRQSGAWGNPRMDDVRERFQNLHEFLKAAQFKLNRNNWDYIVGGTETETTLARNRQSLDCIAFKPRVLRNVQNVDCSTELYGRKVRLPVLIAPVGGLQHVLGGRRRDRRGGGRRVRHPDDAELGDRAADRGGREARARRVQDLPALCARRRQVRRRFLQALAGCGLRAAVLLHGRSRALFAARARRGEAPSTASPTAAWRSIDNLAGLDWGTIERFQKRIPKAQIIIKGIQTAEDAQLCARSRHRRHLRDQSRRTRARSCARRDGYSSRGRRGGERQGAGHHRRRLLSRRPTCSRRSRWARPRSASGGSIATRSPPPGRPGIVRMLELLEDEISRDLGLMGCDSMKKLDRSYVCPAIAGAHRGRVQRLSSRRLQARAVLIELRAPPSSSAKAAIQ